jgi:Zn-dependent protease
MAVAIAGPAVNFALAAGIAIWTRNFGDPATLTNGGLWGESLLDGLYRVNMIMAIFNLVPALPMDGGRILRAGLSLAMPAARATRVAAGVARVIAGGMMLLGITQGFLFLALIGGFVWMSATAELRRAEWLESGRGLVLTREGWVPDPRQGHEP